MTQTKTWSNFPLEEGDYCTNYSPKLTNNVRTNSQATVGSRSQWHELLQILEAITPKTEPQMPIIEPFVDVMELG